MKNLYFIWVQLLFILAVCPGTYAQKAIISTGGNTTSSMGSVSFSIGQIVSPTQIGDNSVIFPGIQHPLEHIISGVMQNNPNNQILIYPNPVTDALFLHVTDKCRETTELLYHLINTNGVVEKTGVIEEADTKIRMNHLAPSIYFLNIMQDSKIIKTFKVIKL